MSDQILPDQTRQMRDSVQHYRSVAEDSPVMISRFLPGGEITYVNDAYCQYFKKTPDELVGQSVFTLVPDADREIVRANLSEITVDSPTMSHEHAVIAPNGELREHRSTNRALFDADGKISAYQSIGEDITERKRAEEETRKSRRMFSDVLDTIPVRVFWKDLDGVFLGCNQLFAQDAGESRPDDIIGKTDKCMPWSEQADLYRSDDSRVIASGKPKINYEEPQTTPEGKRIWLRTSKIPLRNSRGEVYGVLGTYEDITLQKWVKALRIGQQRILELISTGNAPLAKILEEIVRFTEEVFTNVRATVLHVHGGRLWRGVAPSMPAACIDLFDGSEIGPSAGSCGTAAHRGERVIVADVATDPLWAEHRQLGKTYKFKACWSEPILAATGEVVAVFTLYHDVEGAPDSNEIQLIETMAKLISIAIERERAEKARRELEAQLRQSQKMEALGQMAGGVAHDFNNLLTVILGHSEMLLSAAPLKIASIATEPLQSGLRQIQSAGEQAALLTRKLLAFGRRDMPKSEVLEVTSLVAGMEEMLRRLIGEQIKLNFKLCAEECLINADVGQIEQLVLNLVLNARDAMPKGGRLDVEVKQVELDQAYVANHAGAQVGQHVRISVIDNGVGMNPEELERIFEPFFTTKPAGKGTGLGLSTVYATVRQLGGHICVDSEVGVGSSFGVYILITDKPRTAMEQEGEMPGQGAGETILVCEDEAMVSRIMCQTLRSAGYTVIEVRSGKQALTAVADHTGTIDLLVSDVVMPGMSGKDLADRLLQHDPNMRVLFVSGYSENHLDARSVWSGAVEFIQKPFGPKVLLRRVREILDAKKSI
ncbi:MAG: histidine kinase [Phycisphaerae bacterium]|nr:MAG: histidine kinase [Phycisphaerae bacterium]